MGNTDDNSPNKPNLGKEGRRFSRLDLYSKLNGTLIIPEATHVSGCGVVFKDFSKSGAGVFSKNAVPVHKMVHISLEDSGLAPLEGRVVWCGRARDDEGAPSGHIYRLGIDFMPRDDDARDQQLAAYQFIINFAAQHINSSSNKG